MVQRFNHKGLCQYKTAFLCRAPNEDLCGQNFVLLQSTVLREMLDITTDMAVYSPAHLWPHPPTSLPVVPHGSAPAAQL